AYSNWDNPYESTFTIPDIDIQYGYMKVEAYCDPDDLYLRAINIYFDDKGGAIGCCNIAPCQVRGDTILPGEHKILYYDLENIQFATNSEPGSFYIDLLHDKNSSGSEFLAPGIHRIKAYVSSQDRFSGPTQDSWISITLYLNQKMSADIDSTNEPQDRNECYPDNDNETEDTSFSYEFLLGTYMGVLGITGLVVLISSKIKGKNGNYANLI
ncbi:MAG: hypothetical protein ACTSRZ_20250, partial [Promethearchaeota archaeon]